LDVPQIDNPSKIMSMQLFYPRDCYFKFCTPKCCGLPKKVIEDGI
jgi:hypothetical protein